MRVTLLLYRHIFMDFVLLLCNTQLFKAVSSCWYISYSIQSCETAREATAEICPKNFSIRKHVSAYRLHHEQSGPRIQKS